MSETGSQAESSATDDSQFGARTLTTLVSAWLVPGLGHLMLGRRRRAAIFCVIILTAFAIGCSLDGNLHKAVPNQPLTLLATLGSMGIGSPYFVLRFVFGYQGSVIAAGYEYGSAFILTAGLMNLLLILDVWDLLRGRKS